MRYHPESIDIDVVRGGTIRHDITHLTPSIKHIQDPRDGRVAHLLCSPINYIFIEEVLMTIQQKRVVALLDVDNTLIFGASPDIEYNDNLIDTLLENNLKDIYLFSSMSLKQHTIEERVELVKYLEAKGLTVHGVICASDLVWNKDKALLKAFYQAVCKANTDEDIFNLLNQEQLKPLTHFDDAMSGQSFAAVRAGIDGWCRGDAELYQTAASAIRRYLDHNDTSEHKVQIAETEKSHFYHMFARNKPEWAGNVIFVDDADTNINAVVGMHNKLTPEHKLLTILNRDEKRAVKNPKGFYQAIIKPFVEITFALFNAFNSYKLGRQVTHSTAKNEVLERLELALENCKTRDEVNQVKRDFDGEYQQLNHHRFSIWSHAKTRSVTVFDNMLEERKEQLNLS